MEQPSGQFGVLYLSQGHSGMQTRGPRDLTTERLTNGWPGLSIARKGDHAESGWKRQNINKLNRLKRLYKCGSDIQCISTHRAHVLTSRTGSTGELPSISRWNYLQINSSGVVHQDRGTEKTQGWVRMQRSSTSKDQCTEKEAAIPPPADCGWTDKTAKTVYPWALKLWLQENLLRSLPKENRDVEEKRLWLIDLTLFCWVYCCAWHWQGWG